MALREKILAHQNVRFFDLRVTLFDRCKTRPHKLLTSVHHPQPIPLMLSNVAYASRPTSGLGVPPVLWVRRSALLLPPRNRRIGPSTPSGTPGPSQDPNL